MPPPHAQVSVGVITEIILENTSIIVSPFLLYRMYDQPLFMSVVSPFRSYDEFGCRLDVLSVLAGAQHIL